MVLELCKRMARARVHVSTRHGQRQASTVPAAPATVMATPAPILPPAARHLVSHTLPRAIFIDKLVLNSVSLKEPVAVGDGSKIAEDILATINWLDETKAARNPAQRLALESLALL